MGNRLRSANSFHGLLKPLIILVSVGVDLLGQSGGGLLGSLGQEEGTLKQENEKKVIKYLLKIPVP